MQQATSWLFALVAATSCVPDDSFDAIRSPLGESAIAEGSNDELRYPTLGDESVYVECYENGCESGTRAARSNIPPDVLLAKGAHVGPRSLADIQAAELDVGRLSTSRTLTTAARVAADFGTDSPWLLKIWLWEEDFNYAEVRELRSQANGGERIAEIRADLNRASQDVVASSVRELGGRVISRRWLTNSLIVELPAGSVSRLADNPMIYAIYSIENGDEEHKLAVEGDGYVRRNAFNDVYIYQSGSNGGVSGGRMELGVLETNNKLNTTHLGWEDTPGGASRVVSTDDCGLSTCSGTATTSSSTHGTEVASIAAGSILQGQDPGFPGLYTATQWERTGIANEATIRYYDASATFTTADVGNGIQQAVSDTVDVLNMSLGYDEGCNSLCWEALDPTSNNADLYAAENAGVVLIVAAGNEHARCAATNPCTLDWPAFHPDVVAVGALADTSGATYMTTPIASYSSRGRIWENLHDGTLTSRAPVGLTGYGTARSMFSSGDTYVTADSGTSFATPQVASLALGFRQWMNTNGFGYLAASAWAVQVNVLLMGDGRCDAAACVRDYSVDDVYGYGFPKYFVPTTSDMGTGGGWGTRTFTIITGQDVWYDVGTSGPESTSVTGWKWVIAVDSGLNDMPNLNMRVVNTCPPGGGVVVVKSAADQGNRMRIILDDAPNEIHGKCLQMRVSGTSVRSGGDTIWSADYFFTNSQSKHIF